MLQVSCFWFCPLFGPCRTPAHSAETGGNGPFREACPSLDHFVGVTQDASIDDFVSAASREDRRVKRWRGVQVCVAGPGREGFVAVSAVAEPRRTVARGGRY